MSKRGILLIAQGALIGAALGALDLALAFRVEDPSFARRGVDLLLAAAGQGALAGALVLWLATIVRSLGRAREWKTARGDGGAIVAGTVVFALCFGAALIRWGEEHYADAYSRRVLWFAGYGVAAAAIGAAVAAPLAIFRDGARRGRRSAGTRLVLLAAALVLGGSAARVLTGAREPAVPASASAPAQAPNILFVLIDTLRADVLGCYGADGDPTPRMDALAKEGVLFEQSIAGSSWTLPSVTTLFSSKLPLEHGFTAFQGLVDPELEVLPEVLARNGYACRAIIGNGLVSRERGFARGFELFDSYGFQCEGELELMKLLDRVTLLLGPKRQRGPTKRPLLVLDDAFPFVASRMTHYLYDEDLAERTLRLATEPTDEPVFLYVHLLAPHSPYLEHPTPFLPDPPPIEEPHRDELWRRYVGEVTYTDAIVGRLLDELGALDGFLDDAVVLVTSDHGEEFWDHGDKLHGDNGVFQEVVRVPTILRAPGLPRGLRFAHPISHVDVAPTLLDLAGIEKPASFRGKSLVPVLAGEEQPTKRVFTNLLAKHPGTTHEWFGVLEGETKVIRSVTRDGAEANVQVYDLVRDPGERTPIVEDEESTTVTELLDVLRTQAEFAVRGAQRDLDEDDLESMRALGYIE